MIRFLIALAYSVLLIPLYLEWSRGQAESQIDKMQAAVFNTPGAEAPVPPRVIGVGALLLAGYWLLMRLLGAQGWLSALGMLVGAPAGVLIFAQRHAGRGQ
jgi:hypothetical protein